MIRYRLRSLITQFDGGSPPTDISLGGCVDANEEMENFLRCLERSETVKSIFFNTDFLMQMAEDNVLRFFECLGNTCVKELHIQSSSRFHIETIPGETLFPLRNAPRLMSLECQDMQVTATNSGFISALCRTLAEHPTLETVLLPNFFANDFSNTEDDILDGLLITCAAMSALQTFELTGCGSHALSGQTVRLVSPEALRTILSQSRSLTRLHLSFLEFNDEHFESLVEVLSQNTSLINLALDYHDLGSTGFKSIMMAMENNTSIKSLSLRSLREIGLDGFAQVMLMLQFNFVIEILSLTASPSQQSEFDLYLRMNRAGRGKLKDPCVTMNEWITVLARHSDDIDVTRHLLQEVPGLCNAGDFSASEQQRRSSVVGSFNCITFPQPLITTSSK